MIFHNSRADDRLVRADVRPEALRTQGRPHARPPRPRRLRALHPAASSGAPSSTSSGLRARCGIGTGHSLPHRAHLARHARKSVVTDGPSPLSRRRCSPQAFKRFELRADATTTIVT